MKIEVNIPSDLSEITLEQYQNYMRVIYNSNDELFIAQKTVQIFCNVDLQATTKMALNDISDICEHIKKVFESKPKLETIIDFKGVKYGFIPKLDDISLGELIDVSNNIGEVDNLHIAMSVLYRKVKGKFRKLYNIEEYEASLDNAELMKDLPLNIVFGSMLFFWTLTNDLLNHIPNYLEEKMEEMNTHSRDNSESVGVGIIQSINFLKEMLPSLMKSLNNPLVNA